MRQRARHKRVIGTTSSGIEHEMTREWEPPPSYHRHPRRFIKLTAYTTTPSPSGGQRGGMGKLETGADRQPTRQAERRTQHRTIRTQARNSQAISTPSQGEPP